MVVSGVRGVLVVIRRMRWTDRSRVFLFGIWMSVLRLIVGGVGVVGGGVVVAWRVGVYARARVCVRACVLTHTRARDDY